jgi:alkylated DNA repair dioxygenase AlkB
MNVSVSDLSSQLDTMKKEQLQEVLKYLEVLLTKTRECLLTPKEKPEARQSSISQELFACQQHGLDKLLMEDVLKHLETLDYHRNSCNRFGPETHLYGSQRYCYNPQSATVDPTPIESNRTMLELLEKVNTTMGTKHNSMLINRYNSYKHYLGAHKDDEKCLDPTAPISTLSFGATRRLNISLNAAKHKTVQEVLLTSGSMFTMLPGFQDSYYHSLARGRKSRPGERGVRYSITFRQLLPSLEENQVTEEPVPVVDIQSSPTTTTSPAAKVRDGNTPDTFVFGSSLLKGLDEHKLSKHAKNFKVFCNRGAVVRNIYEDVEKVRDGQVYDTTKVTTVFLLCGGNDVESLGKGGNINFLYEDIEDLVDLVKEVFPNAKVHFISLIPRKARYFKHIRNMHKVNDWLSVFCRKNSVRFVDIFSFFVNITPSGWLLNLKLFNRSKLHFSLTGDSVLAKVCIGVANSPRS